MKSEHFKNGWLIIFRTSASEDSEQPICCSETPGIHKPPREARLL